jgi:hypothetical protein
MPGSEPLGELFGDDASYRMSPFEEPVAGLRQIGALWERERQGPDERFEMAHEIVAVEADTAVVRVEVRYSSPEPLHYRDLWVIRFAEDGRCMEFEEWPFWPGKGFSAKGGSQ